MASSLILLMDVLLVLRDVLLAHLPISVQIVHSDIERKMEFAELTAQQPNLLELSEVLSGSLLFSVHAVTA